MPLNLNISWGMFVATRGVRASTHILSQHPTPLRNLPPPTSPVQIIVILKFRTPETNVSQADQPFRKSAPPLYSDSRELLLSLPPKMAAPEVHHLFHNPIADHSFSADRKLLAVARNTSVELYGRVANSFKLKDELKGHDKTVTSVDIAPNSGRIVTCSQGM